MRGGLIRRMIIASALLATILGGVFAFLIYAVTVQRNAAESARHTQQTLAVANKLERLVVDVETGERGYVLTQRPVFLNSWRTARAQLPATSDRLEEQLRDAQNERQRQRAHQLTDEVRSYVDSYSVPAVDAARRGDPSAVSESTALRGKVKVDGLRRDFKVFASVAHGHSAERVAQAAQAATAAIIAGTAGAVGSAVLVIVFALYVSRAVLGPVRQGATMAGRLATGELSAQMPENGIGEIGVLQQAFNTMGSSLQHSRDELTRLADEQAALRRVATLVAHAAPSSDVFTAVTEEVGRLLQADGTRLFRYESDGTTIVVASWGAPELGLSVGTRLPVEGRNLATLIRHTGAAARVDNIGGASGSVVNRLRRAGVRSGVGAPITVQAKLWGGLVAMSSEDQPFPPRAEYRFADFSDLTATAIANTQSREDLVGSRARVVAAIDQTRRRVERDLHDGVQQRLVSVTLGLRSMDKDLPDGTPTLRAQIARVADGVAETLDELREVAQGIHPAILSEAGLRPALRSLARRTPVAVDLDLRIGRTLPAQVEAAAYYVVAEALTNTTKYARATLVRVAVTLHDHRLHVTVDDDGVGGAEPRNGTGLLGLHDRVESLGGVLVVSSAPGVGTTLDVDLPVDAPTDPDPSGKPDAPANPDASGKPDAPANPRAPIDADAPSDSDAATSPHASVDPDTPAAPDPPPDPDGPAR
ncbi:MAG: CHASE3 domain-containing protein [Actinocatenispora sp.]